jgi:hypothetical protein
MRCLSVSYGTMTLAQHAKKDWALSQDFRVLVQTTAFLSYLATDGLK